MKALLPLALFGLLLGCSASTGPGVAGSTESCKGANCGRTSQARPGTGGSSATTASSSPGSSASSASVGSSSGGGSSSSGSTSVGGSSSGGNGQDGMCTNLIVLPDGGGCPNGSFATQIVDFLTCSPIAGATIQALDVNGVPAAGGVTTAADGTFVLCAPPGAAFTPSLAVPGDPTTYLAELLAGHENNYSNIPVASRTDLSAIFTFLPGVVDASLGSILVTFITTPTCPDPSGWTMTLDYADGGAVPDGGYLEAYLDATGLPDATLTATSSAGDALLYNVDLTLTNYFSVILSNPNPGNCAPTPLTAFPSGRIYATAEGISYEAVQVP